MASLIDGSAMTFHLHFNNEIFFGVMPLGALQGKKSFIVYL